MDHQATYPADVTARGSDLPAAPLRFFRRLHTAVDVVPLLEELQAQAHAWLLNTSRQDRIRVQRDTHTIFLRSAVPRPDLNPNENQESGFTATARLFPRAVSLMTQAAKQLNGSLSRATIVRLKPHAQVLPHIDAGSYYLIRHRLHLVLQSTKGSVLTSGDETVRMWPGELWWFDNKQHHAAENPSDDWRIHYIFDVLPERHRHLARNPLPPGGAA